MKFELLQKTRIDTKAFLQTVHFLKVGGILYSGLNITNSIINKEAVFGSKNHALYCWWFCCLYDW